MALPENRANGISYWVQVAEEQAHLTKALVGMPWQKADCIYLRDNGRRLPGLNPNPNRHGAVSIIGSTKRAAELIFVGNHELCTQAEVEAYEAQQERQRAEAGAAAAAKRGTIQFTAPTFGGSPSEIEMLKTPLAQLEAK